MVHAIRDKKKIPRHQYEQLLELEEQLAEKYSTPDSLKELQKLSLSYTQKKKKKKSPEKPKSVMRNSNALSISSQKRVRTIDGTQKRRLDAGQRYQYDTDSMFNETQNSGQVPGKMPQIMEKRVNEIDRRSRSIEPEMRQGAKFSANDSDVGPASRQRLKRDFRESEKAYNPPEEQTFFPK